MKVRVAKHPYSCRTPTPFNETPEPPRPIRCREFAMCVSLPNWYGCTTAIPMGASTPTLSDTPLSSGQPGPLSRPR